MKASYHTLRLVLGDQLNSNHPWFDETDPAVLYLIAELKQEATYARHHIQKVCAFFLAMQRFAEALREDGHDVLYLTLDETANHTGLPALLASVIEQYRIQRFEYQLPDEYRLANQLARFAGTLTLDSNAAESHHFLLARSDIDKYFAADKHAPMESFYRRIRKEFDILMENGAPVGGRWNFDKENRKRLPQQADVPAPKCFSDDVGAIVSRIKRHGVETIGTLDANVLAWPVTRAESLELLRFFLGLCLPDFGRYQDALSERGWSLFHSRLSFSLNTKLVSPLDVTAAASEHWNEHPDDITLAQVEGFVRQIVGWREYMRGIYWTHMPRYASLNGLGHELPLPSFYWDGATRMRCMARAIGQSLEHAYAHHIQRLMVTGNFALLLGVHPDEVDAWYLGIYIDALDWVEITTTRGMSQFADGGIVATKPYVSSGKYIQRMGDHCKVCRYDISKRHGDDACPFNVLYWDFLDRHRDRFEPAPRMRMMYANLDRIPARELNEIRGDAKRLRENADNL